MRLVVDTNLMIRALLSEGPARRFFKRAPISHELLYHIEQLVELRDVAARPRLNVPFEAVDELIDRVQQFSTLGAVSASCASSSSFKIIHCRSLRPLAHPNLLTAEAMP